MRISDWSSDVCSSDLAMTLGNVGGTVSAQDALSFTGTTLDNTGGNLAGNAAVTLDLLGALPNTNGKLASVGPLRVEPATQVNNQGGDRKSVGQGKSGSVRGERGGRRCIKKKKK